MDKTLKKAISAIEAVQGHTNPEYKEIFRLEQMLLSAGIPYQLREIFDGWQIGYPENREECICSVIEHFGSYGHEDDLLEIMGLTENEDEVEGFLSAEEVYNRILTHFKGCGMKL